VLDFLVEIARFHVSIRSFPYVLLSVRLPRLFLRDSLKIISFFFLARITEPFCSFSV
jgi:hypothetical protein